MDTPTRPPRTPLRDVTDLTDARTRSSGFGSAPGSSSGWLSSSDSIDHGRFAPGVILDSRYRILSLIGRGLSSREAAEALGLSVKTVETHRQSLKRKLNLATNAQLLQYAINWYASRSKPPAAASPEPDPAGS